MTEFKEGDRVWVPATVAGLTEGGSLLVEPGFCAEPFYSMAADCRLRVDLLPLPEIEAVEVTSTTTRGRDLHVGQYTTNNPHDPPPVVMLRFRGGATVTLPAWVVEEIAEEL